MMLDDISLMADALPSSPLISAAASNYAVDAHDRNPAASKATRLGGLVLTRHLGESIVIGDEVEVHVVDIKPGTARLKVVAPRTVEVHRREVFDSIQAGEPRPSRPAPTPPANPRPGKGSGGLVLARSVHQSIMIGEDVEVSVVEVRPSTVKLKVVAPRSIKVDRREVHDRREHRA
jgi:carbon storage regulator